MKRTSPKSALVFAAISTLISVCVLTPAALNAGEAESSVNWAKILKEGVLELNPTNLPSRIEAEAKLASAMRRLESFLMPSESPNGAKWMKFLRWERLKEIVANPNATASDYAEIETSFRQNYVGLEMRPFTEVRDALGEVGDALRYGTDSKQTIDFLKRRLEELDQHLQQHSVIEQELERSRDTGLILSYLWDSHQAPKLRSIIRKEYSKPNMQIIVKESLANKAVGRVVHQTNPVHEVILGTNMNGCATIDGHLHCSFLPNSHQAQFQLILRGKVSSDNVGYNRGVRIDSRGYADVHVTRSLTLVPSDSEPLNFIAGSVCIDSDFCSVIDSISHRSNLVRKIATKKAAKSKSSADIIAEGRLQKRVSDQFRQQTDEQLLQRDAVGLVVMDRLGLDRPDTKGYTTDEDLHLYLDHGHTYQLSAPSSCGLAIPEGDVVVRVHQSVVMNYGDSILGGRVLQSEELPDLAKQIFGKVPEEMLNQEDQRPWSITFANFHPVEMDLRGGQIKITVRLSRTERGDQSLNEPLIVTAIYQPISVDGKTELVRQGEVRIDLVGERARGTRAVTLQAFLKGKFDKFFREKLLDEAPDEENPPAILAKLKERFPNLPKLQVADLKIEQGWLQAALR